MKKFQILVTLVTFSFVLTSCATTTQYVKFPNDAIKESNSRVIIVRPSILGCSINFKIYQNDTLIGKLGSLSYLKWDIPQNEIRIKSSAENKEIVTISPIPGKTYYLKQRVKMGVLIARTSIEQISEEEAIGILKKLNKPKVNYFE